LFLRASAFAGGYGGGYDYYGGGYGNYGGYGGGYDYTGYGNYGNYGKWPFSSDTRPPHTPTPSLSL